MKHHEVDVSVVLPVFNEKGHLLDELDRIRKSLEASSWAKRDLTRAFPRAAAFLTRAQGFAGIRPS